VNPDIKAEQAEVDFWTCPRCGGTCDQVWDGNIPWKKCQEIDCDFGEELSIESNDDVYY